MRCPVLLTTTLALLAACAAPSLYAGQVYRCIDAAGHVEYRDAGCAANESGGPVRIEPNVTPGVDPRAVQAESKSIAERAAARAAAEDEAARARAHRQSPEAAPSYSVPWWMMPGPPPERASGQKSGSDYNPPAATGKR